MDAASFWDQKYSAGAIWGIQPNQLVADLVKPLSPGRALDLGAGQGRHAVWLATLGFEVTAVDISAVGIEQGRRLAGEAGVDVDWIEADITQWTPEGGYDLVLAAYLQLADGDRRAAHRAAVEALAPGGTLIVVAHHRDNLTGGVGGPQSPEVLFTESELRADFRDLEVVRCERVLREVDGAGTAIDVVCVATRPAGGGT